MTPLERQVLDILSRHRSANWYAIENKLSARGESSYGHLAETLDGMAQAGWIIAEPNDDELPTIYAVTPAGEVAFLTSTISSETFRRLEAVVAHAIWLYGDKSESASRLQTELSNSWKALSVPERLKLYPTLGEFPERITLRFDTEADLRPRTA
jgi:hypothetical protein